MHARQLPYDEGGYVIKIEVGESAPFLPANPSDDAPNACRMRFWRGILFHWYLALPPSCNPKSPAK